MTDSPQVPPQSMSSSSAIKCPKCKYDLRAQLGPPIPATITCPECGSNWDSRLLFEFRARAAFPVLLFIFAALGLPAMLIALGFLGGESAAILLFVVFRPGFAIIAAAHVLLTMIMATRFARYKHSFTLAIWVIGCTIIWDTVVVMLLLAARVEMH